MYQIIKGRFEFDHIHSVCDLCRSDICEMYFDTDRANEEIIDTFGDWLYAENELLIAVDNGAQTIYDSATGRLTGYIFFLQYADIDDDGEMIYAQVLRAIAAAIQEN